LNFTGPWFNWIAWQLTHGASSALLFRSPDQSRRYE
jgi:hypothetical protein